MNRMIGLALLLLLALMPLTQTHAQGWSKRAVIAQCARGGAINIPMMRACSGLDVPPPIFASCMAGGACFDEPPIALPPPPPVPGAPFCGAPGAPECAAPIPCGFTNTVDCRIAAACGARPFAACLGGIPCGLRGALPCPWVAGTPPLPQPFIPVPVYNAFIPQFRVVLPPPGVQGTGPMPLPAPVAPPVTLVAPALPDLGRLQMCRDNAPTEQAFNRCVVTSAMSGMGHLSSDCLNRFRDDFVRAVACSAADPRLGDQLDTASAAAKCSEQSGADSDDFHPCVATTLLGGQRRDLLNCATQNYTQSDIAYCALAARLTLEQPELIKCAKSDNTSVDLLAQCVAQQASGSHIATLGTCVSQHNDAFAVLSCLAGDSLSSDERDMLSCANDAEDFTALRQCVGPHGQTVAGEQFWNCVYGSGESRDLTAHCLASTLLDKNQQAYFACAQAGETLDVISCAGGRFLGANGQNYLQCATQDNGSALDIATCMGEQHLGQRERAIAKCGMEADGKAEILACIGGQYLGSNERRYVECAVQNHFDLAGTAVCSLTDKLNPEMQIAVGCAVASGGEPMTFAGCTAGRLGARELEKCWRNGIGGDDGCYGKNNTIRKFYEGVDSRMRQILGPNSAAYMAFVAMTPQSPESMKAFAGFVNDGVKSLQNDPLMVGQYVKAAGAVSDGFTSVGRVIGDAGRRLGL